MADDLKSLAKRLKAAGETGLSRELNKGINSAVKPLKKDLVASARSTLPRRGGLAERIAKSRYSTLKRPDGIVIKVKNQYHLDLMDDPGRLRHPTFRKKSVVRRALGLRQKSKLGKRKKWKWVNQKVRPGWWTEPVNKRTEQVTKDMRKAIDTVVRQIEGKG